MKPPRLYSVKLSRGEINEADDALVFRWLDLSSSPAFAKQVRLLKSVHQKLRAALRPRKAKK